jgi:lipopolysaccharide export system protein LptC
MNTIPRTHSPSPPRTGPRSRNGEEAFRQARRHSRLVSALKVVLPVSAVLMVAGFAAYSFLGVPRGMSVDLGGTTIESGRLIMSNPELNGHTRDNRAYSVRASRAIQEVGNTSVIELEKIDARLPLDDTQIAEIVAEKGVFDRDANLLDLAEGMTIRMDNGITAVFRSARVDIGQGSLTSPDPVAIEMEGGRIAADSMRVSERGNVLIFENRVRMEIDARRLQAAARNGGASDAQ